MKGDSSPYPSHLSGEQSLIVAKRPPEGVDLDSFFGPVRVEWDHEAAMTPLGQLPFFGNSQAPPSSWRPRWAWTGPAPERKRIASRTNRNRPRQSFRSGANFPTK